MEIMSRRLRQVARRLVAAAVVVAAVAGAACASSQPRIAIEPGVQRSDAEVDWQTGSVTLIQERVEVSAQGAMLPSPRGRSQHPTFWVTIENHREERVSARPTDARLVDAFGNQLEPVPMCLDRGGREVRYALVDPEIRTYVSLHYGWPFYPVYPYPGWFVHPRYGRVRYWHPDPFWTFGFGPVWIMEVRPRPVPPPPRPSPDKVEFIYGGARLTYVVIFPEIDPMGREMRLIVPGVAVTEDEGSERHLEFELVFEQIPDPTGP